MTIPEKWGAVFGAGTAMLLLARRMGKRRNGTVRILEKNSRCPLSPFPLSPFPLSPFALPILFSGWTTPWKPTMDHQLTDTAPCGHREAIREVAESIRHCAAFRCSTPSYVSCQVGVETFAQDPWPHSPVC